MTAAVVKLPPAKPPSSLGRRSKWAACIDAILSNDRIAENASDKERYLQDLFCLRPDGAELATKLDAATETQLLVEFQPNVSDFFAAAVRTLRYEGPEDVRCQNVVETLNILCARILTKRFPNYALDVINTLAGSLDQSDSVFSDFVAGVDNVMRDPDVELSLRRQSLRLALTLVAGVNQASINAYFLRRDLFNTIASLISDPQTTSMAFDAVLLLGFLANFRKYEARNPYLVRIEDWVDEKAMEKMLALVEIALNNIRKVYLDVLDDASSSFVGSVTSLVASLRLGDLVKSPLASLPQLRATPPVPGCSMLSSYPDSTRPTSPSPPSSMSSHPFKGLPPPQSCILLPLYDLLHSNKAFLALFLAPDTTFLTAYLSAASYLLTHASNSARAWAYSKLIVLSLTVIVEEGGRGLCYDERAIIVRLCRQRVPPLPPSDASQPPICAIVDCVVLYLRHNLQNTLNADAYVASLKLVYRILITLQASRIRLDYNWAGLWQALISLGDWLASRIEELHTLGQTDTLAQQILNIFSFAAIWAESLFRDTDSVAVLYYEILRAEPTLHKLGDIGGVGSLPATPTRNAGSPWMNGAAGPSGASSSADPCTIEAVWNVRRIITHFGEKVDTAKKAKGGSIAARDVIATIKLHIDALDLIDAASLQGVSWYSETEHIMFFRDLTRCTTQDALDMLSKREVLV